MAGIALISLPGIRLGDLTRQALDLLGSPDLLASSGAPRGGTDNSEGMSKSVPSWQVVDLAGLNAEQAASEIEKTLSENRTGASNANTNYLWTLPSNLATDPPGPHALAALKAGGVKILYVAATWQESAAASGISGSQPVGMVPVRAAYRIMAGQRQQAILQVADGTLEGSSQMVDMAGKLAEILIESGY